MTKAAKGINPKSKKPVKPASWWQDPRTVTFIIAIAAFLLYANSLTNGFILDDSLVITKNAFTTKGAAGLGGIFSHDTFQGYYGESADEIKVVGGRYRPLSVAFFAILYQMFGSSSIIFHLWNVIMYCVCCALLYRVLRYAFDPLLGITTAAAFLNTGF